MSYFKCYSCWRSLGYRGPKTHLVCPGCDAKLMVNASIKDNIAGKSYREYNELAGKLREMLAKNSEIYKGNDEAIAGPDSQFTPDAIYYQRGELLMRKPLIYEIITCDSINHETTIAKCRLFSETAQNLFSQFYLAVPKDCQGKDGEDLARTMLKVNEIALEAVKILAL